MIDLCTIYDSTLNLNFKPDLKFDVTIDLHRESNEYLQMGLILCWRIKSIVMRANLLKVVTSTVIAC